MNSFMSGGETPDSVRLVGNSSILESCVAAPAIGHARIKPYGLTELDDLNIQQALIIKDLLFVLLGNEGLYIRYGERFDPNFANSRLIGPDYKIAKHLDLSLKGIVKRLVKYGKFYYSLSSFISIFEEEKYGKVVQSLVFEVTSFINRYNCLVVTIENEFEMNPNFNLRELETMLANEASIPLNHLYEIISVIHVENEERIRVIAANRMNNDFNNFIRNIENDLRETGSIDFASDNSNFHVLKGGLIIKIIQDRINTYKGDSISYEFLTNLLDSVSEEYVNILNDWLIRGEINDPYDEFFIKQNPPTKITKFIGTNTEKYWDEMFMIRKDGLIPQFNKRDLQLRILYTGKYLNILKECGIDDFDDVAHDRVLKLTSNDLELRINNLYSRSNKLILKLLFEGYQLKTILKNFQKHYLLGDFYNYDQFLSVSFYDLKKNKKLVSKSKLIKSFNYIFNRSDEAGSGINIEEILNNSRELAVDSQNYLDSSLEILNVKSFDAQAALRSKDSNSIKLLLNKSLEASSKPSSSVLSETENKIDEYSITGLNLEMTLPFPLNLIITQNFILEYQLIFKLLINLQFLLKSADSTWKEINCSYVWTFKNYDNKVKKWILRCRILHDRMRDFLMNVQYYLNFDIIELNWNDLVNKLNTIEEYTHKKEAEPISPVNSQPFLYQPRQSRVFGATGSHNNPFSNVLNEDTNVKVQDKFDLVGLNDELESFLNNILKNCFLTNKDLIELLKSFFNLITQYNNYLMNLKKSLILINYDLFEEFRVKYPQKFENKEINNEKIDSRFNILNESLNTYYEFFNNYLGDFINSLKYYGELESAEFLVLVERLENCFPE